MVLHGLGGNDTLVVAEGASYFGDGGDDIFLFENGLDTTSITILFGGVGTDTIRVSGADGDVFEILSDASMIEAIDFAADGSNIDKEIIVRGGEFDSQSEFSLSLIIDGNHASGSTDIFTIDNTLSGTNLTSLDLSAFTYVNWGGQGDHVRFIGRDSLDEDITGSNFIDVLLGGGGDDLSLIHI